MHMQTVIKGATELLASVTSQPSTARKHHPNLQQTAIPINKRSVAAISRGCDGLDIVGIGTTNAILHKYISDHSGNSDWEFPGGYASSPPTVVSPQFGQLDIIYRGHKSSAFRFSYDGWTWNSSNGGG